MTSSLKFCPLCWDKILQNVEQKNMCTDTFLDIRVFQAFHKMKGSCITSKYIFRNKYISILPNQEIFSSKNKPVCLKILFTQIRRPPRQRLGTIFYTDHIQHHSSHVCWWHNYLISPRDPVTASAYIQIHLDLL